MISRALATLAIVAPVSFAQVQVVVPNAQATQPGDILNRLPFGPNASDLQGRYQQVYDSSELGALLGQPITSIAFRMNETEPDVPAGNSYVNMRIGLSTSVNPIDQLSGNYQANVGFDEVTVFNGPYDIPALSGQSLLNPFDMEILFTDSFTYTGGDLLVDIEIQYATQPVFYLDAQFVVGDSVSRALQYQGGPELDTLGLITRFGSEAPIGSSYCFPAVPNSTGQPGRIQAAGSPFASDNAFFLNASQIPPNEPGYFLASASQGFIQNPGGSQGNLCLALPLARFANQIVWADAGGAMGIQVDLNAIPLSPPVVVQAGETWNFQCWYRDQNPNSTSNFTDAVSVVFQ